VGFSRIFRLGDMSSPTWPRVPAAGSERPAHLHICAGWYVCALVTRARVPAWLPGAIVIPRS
jgi:hypothetical protein